MNLPDSFREQIQPLLGSEWFDFTEALHLTPMRAIRLHRLSQIPDVLKAFCQQPVPWTTDGYYVPYDTRLGKSVYHETGAFYMQEPSAMAIVAALDPQPGERVLDLCAAPGGKSTAIGRRMLGQGQLVANEIHPTRVTILAENLERLGVPALITNESPANLANAWSGYFDAILVDAPCSGEGMFRKDPLAIESWSADAPALCANRQHEILAAAVQLLKPGGRLVYSTCTFNPLENEQVVDWLVRQHGFVIEELPMWPGWSEGQSDFASGLASLTDTRRLWPHKARGEGHFVARLRAPDRLLTAEPTQDHFAQGKRRNKSRSAQQSTHSGTHALTASWQAWVDEHVEQQDNDQHRHRTEFGTQHTGSAEAIQVNWRNPLQRGNLLFSNEVHGLPLANLKVLRLGVPLANLERGRIEPLHGFAMSISASMAKNPAEFDESAAISYCRGEALPANGGRGLQHMQINGLPLGWGKGLADRINNLYPKGLRRTDLIPLSWNRPELT